MDVRGSVLLLTAVGSIATSAVLSAQRPPQPLLPGQPVPPSRSLRPSLKPRVVCGMTLIPAPPGVDPKIASPESPGRPRDPTTYTVRPVQPSICW